MHTSAIGSPARKRVFAYSMRAMLIKLAGVRPVSCFTARITVSLRSMARIEYAKTRLRAGDPIADVGYQAGFADQSHFHKTFVSYTAATPRQYAQSRSISDNK